MATRMREWCWLRALWYRLRWPFGVPVSGHEYVVEETVEGCTVEVSRCRCGKLNVVWWKTSEPPLVER